MNKSSLEPIAVALSDVGYRAVLVDLPGHGESDGQLLSYVPRKRSRPRACSTCSSEAVSSWARWEPMASRTAPPSPSIGQLQIREYERSWRFRRSAPARRRRRLPPQILTQVREDLAGRLVSKRNRRRRLARRLRSRRQRALAQHRAHCPDAVDSRGRRYSGTPPTQPPPRASERRAGRAGRIARRFASMPLDATHAIRARAIAWFDARLHRDQREATSDVR
jgi:hypothetical protein